MNDALIQIKNLEVMFKTKRTPIKAVDDTTLTVGKNECVALIGESGSGKSTIANTILRVLPENAQITGGEIQFKTQNLLDRTEGQLRTIRGKEISMVFQDPYSYLNPVLKIGDQLTETIQTHNSNLTKEQTVEKAIELLTLVKIPDASQILKRYPFQLSGGMAQRVAISLALCSNPVVVIADEPTSSLDLTIQAQIIKLLKSLMDLLNISVLLITHDLSLVSNLATKVYVMQLGKIVEEDTVEGLYDNPTHPYTQMLLAAIKQLQGTSSTSFDVTSMKEPSADPVGCKFTHRCPFVKPVCRQKPPPYVSLTPTKKVLCWLVAQGDENEHT